MFLGAPCIASKNGIERVIELDLNVAEREGLSAAALVVKDHTWK